MLTVTLCSSVCEWHTSLYVTDTYCCRHMSRDIEDFLESLGIDVLIRVGYVNDSCGHMWVEVFGIEFDSVDLRLRQNSIKYNKWQRTYNDYKEWVNE